MTYEQEFLKDFEAWVVTQVKVNETALAASKKIWEEDGDERARDASYRYEDYLDGRQADQHGFDRRLVRAL